MTRHALPATITTLTSAKTNKDDRRVMRRFASREINATFIGTDHPALNWSLRGMLVEDRNSSLAIGASISGILTIKGADGRFRFSAEIVRRDPRRNELAFRFIDPSPSLAKVLHSTSGEGHS
jgi:hypothetical protein